MRTRTAGAVTALIVGAVFLTVMLAGISTQKEQRCSVEMNTALIYQRVSSTFSSSGDGDIVKEVFAEDRGRVFVQIFGGISPAQNPAFSSDAVIAFSVPGKTLLLFFKNSCLVLDTLVSSSVYADVKAKIRGKFRELKF